MQSIFPNNKGIFWIALLLSYSVLFVSYWNIELPPIPLMHNLMNTPALRGPRMLLLTIALFVLWIFIVSASTMTWKIKAWPLFIAFPLAIIHFGYIGYFVVNCLLGRCI